MAIIQFSPIVSSIRGKLGGSVIQGGRGNFVLKQKNKNGTSDPKPADPPPPTR